MINLMYDYILKINVQKKETDNSKTTKQHKNIYIITQKFIIYLNK